MGQNTEEKDGMMNMSTYNDERIIKLKSQIEEKKKALNKFKTKFTPETNCCLALDNIRYNLHTVFDDYLLLKLYSLQMAAEKLNIDTEDVIISGYPLSMWIDDVKNKLDVEKYKAKKRELDNLEKQLTSLLSDDKQTELKIDELEALINA